MKIEAADYQQEVACSQPKAAENVFIDGHDLVIQDTEQMERSAANKASGSKNIQPQLPPENPVAINDAPQQSEGRFECSSCGKIFTRKWDCNRHKNIHSGKRPYQCQYCPKTFTQQSNLNTHVKLIHTKNLQHKCTLCNKEFVYKSLLKIHTREKHLAATDPQKYFPCQLCDKKFKTKSVLKYHKSRLHRQNSATFTCEHCGKTFSRRQYIVEHMKIHKETKNFKCKHCNKTFAQSSGKWNHERKCVLKSV